MTNKNKKSKIVMNKLKGLEPHQHRLHFVRIGKGYRNKKIYFKTAQEAISFYQVIDKAEPIETDSESIYSSEYPNIEEQLDKDKESLSFTYPVTNLEIILGSEVVNMFDNKQDAFNAKRKKEAELKIRNSKAPKVTKKKDKDNIPF
jgi:folate-binding Fe-S cluster repair protein YgfZ